MRKKHLIGLSFIKNKSALVKYSIISFLFLFLIAFLLYSFSPINILNSPPSSSSGFTMAQGAGDLNSLNSTNNNYSIVPYNQGGYNYSMTNGTYQVYFKGNSKSSNAVVIMKDGYQISMDILTSQLHWYNSSLNAIIGMQQEMNPQNNNATINGNTIIYPNAWINTNLSYSFISYPLSLNALKENLIIANVSKPSSGINPDYLQYVSNINFNNTMYICNDSNCYLHPSSKTIISNGSIYFKDPTNKTIFILPVPYITDSANNTVLGYYSVSANNGIAVVNIRIPKSFIDNSTYPLYFDPSIILGTNAGFITGSAPTGDPGGDSFPGYNHISAFVDTSPSGATKVSEMGVYMLTTDGGLTIDFAIYSNNASNRPGSLIGTTSVFANSGAGWYSATGLNIPISGSTPYWIAVSYPYNGHFNSMEYTSAFGTFGQTDAGVVSMNDPFPGFYSPSTGTLGVYAISDGGGPSDNNYPKFSNYYSNNASYVGVGNVTLNVTVTSTNGTVQLTFNNTIYKASNQSDPTVFNVTILNYGNGTFIYNWTSYGNGTSTNVNSSINFYYTINNSISADTQPPYFTNSTPQNQTITYGNPLSYYVNATDNTAMSCFAVNDTKFRINCSGYLQNNSLLSAGTYYLNISINDTSNNLNSTIMFVNVTKLMPTLIYFINSQINNISIVYPQQVNATATTNAGVLSIYRNGINVTSQNGLNVSLSVGNYNYIFNVTGNANYSDIPLINMTINVTIAVSKTSLIFDKTSPQIYGIAITPTCSIIAGGSEALTLANGTSGSPETLGAGNWTINCSYPGNTNYTASSNMTIFNITKATASLGITRTTPIIYPATTDFTGTNCPAELSCNLNISNGIFGVGVINANYSTNGDTNYTPSSVINSITINQNTTPCNIYFNKTSPQIYPIPFGVFTNCSTAYTIYRNGTSVSNGSVQDLPASANYNFTIFRTDNMNYSNNVSNATFTITKGSINLILLLNGIANNLSLFYPQQVNASATSSNGVLVLYKNLVNDTINNGFNQTLAVGNYTFFVNATGNQNYSDNNTGVYFTAQMLKGTPIFSYYINSQINNISIVYNTSRINATLIANTGVPVIYRGGINVSSENGLNADLPVGNYSYLFNITGNANYSDISSFNMSINITQATAITYAYANDSRSNISVNNISIWLNGTLQAGQGNITLFLNGTNINNGTYPLYTLWFFNDSNFLYNFTSFYAGNINYTRAYETWWINSTNQNITIPPVTPPSGGGGGGGSPPSGSSINLTNISIDGIICKDTVGHVNIYPIDNKSNNVAVDTMNVITYPLVNSTLIKNIDLHYTLTILNITNSTDNNFSVDVTAIQNGKTIEKKASFQIETCILSFDLLKEKVAQLDTFWHKYWLYFVTGFAVLLLLLITIFLFLSAKRNKKK